MSLGDKLRDIAENFGVQRTILSEIDELVELSQAQRALHKDVHRRDFEPHEGGITLVPLSDVHLGSTHTDRAKLQSIVDYILRTPGCYTLLLGDAAETATKTSVGMGLYEEDMHLRQQLMTLRSILQPLAQAKKILGIHTGNHEFRCAILTGLNPMEILSSELGVPYLGYQGYYVLKVGNQKYHMMSHHGAGGGRTSGAKANAAERPAHVAPLCDIYLTGHTHTRSVHDGLKFYINDEDQLASKKQYYIVCGSFLDYFGGYAEMQMLPPTPTGVANIKLFSDTHNIRVCI